MKRLLFIFFIIIFISVPLVFIYTSTRQNKNVKGAQTKISEIQNGFLVYVTSKANIWDLNEYLCVSEDECLSSLDSGKKWSVISSGPAQNHEIIVQATKEWDSYKYIKIFVKSSYAGVASSLKPELLSQEGASVHEISYQNQTYSVVMVDIEKVKLGVHQISRFID